MTDTSIEHPPAVTEPPPVQSAPALRVVDRPNPHAEAWAQFCDFTARHQLVVIRDDDLYKHLRMQEPGTGVWHWDIVTWPGHLCIVGDIGDGHVFSRDTDMLAFFDRGLRFQFPDGAPSIDFRYWAEKLARGSASVKDYSEAAFMQRVREHLAEAYELPDDTKADLLAEASEVAGSRDLQMRWLYDQEAFSGADVSDWDTTEWNHHFVLNCYAIAATVNAWNGRTQDGEQS